MIKVFCDGCDQEIKPSELGNPVATIQFMTPTPKGMATEEKNLCQSCTSIIKDAVLAIKPKVAKDSKLSLN